MECVQRFSWQILEFFLTSKIGEIIHWLIFSYSKRTMEAKEEDWKSWHGFGGKSTWPLPRVVARSDKPSREDQNNMIKANEYLDEKEVLEEKIDVKMKFRNKFSDCRFVDKAKQLFSCIHWCWTFESIGNS